MKMEGGGGMGMDMDRDLLFDAEHETTACGNTKDKVHSLRQADTLERSSGHCCSIIVWYVEVRGLGLGADHCILTGNTCPTLDRQVQLLFHGETSRHRYLTL